MPDRLNERHGNSNSEGDEQLQAEYGVNFADESPTHLGILLHAWVELLPVALLQIHVSLARKERHCSRNLLDQPEKKSFLCFSFLEEFTSPPKKFRDFSGEG